MGSRGKSPGDWQEHSSGSGSSTAMCVRDSSLSSELLERGEGVAASVRAKALNGAGWLALWQGEYGRAEALCEESLELYRELHDQRGIALSPLSAGAARLDARRLSQGHLPARGKRGTLLGK